MITFVTVVGARPQFVKAAIISILGVDIHTAKRDYARHPGQVLEGASLGVEHEVGRIEIECQGRMIDLAHQCGHGCGTLRGTCALNERREFLRAFSRDRREPLCRY